MAWPASRGDRRRIAYAAMGPGHDWPDAALFVAEAVSCAAVLGVTRLLM
ncbi:hypothetical protein OG223_53620 [Streptomyces sp. NBC_01478]|nr:hypothetical protein [Streptomyces sp. NBC_01478]